MANPDIRAVLWDFGGVLTTSPFDAFSAYESEFGLPPGAIRTLNATNPDDNAWARFERSHIAVDEFATLFEKEATDAGLSIDAMTLLSKLSGEIRPAMVEALRRCHERLKTGLLTNNFILDEGSRVEDGYAPVLELFDAVIQSSTSGFRKPDPRFYATACEMLAIQPNEAVFLDDLGVNLKPARQMGMTTIKVIDPELAIAELEEILGFPLRGD
ncbi:MAG TPA: HAD-IA family hydrolase [Acidimicrobiales bacterium]|nr:HAD-IA family hydrolase [Acidimicrobiales bacterium]